MSRIQATFADLKGRQRKALIPFITAGDPYPSLTVPLMHALVSAGADVLELGVPFSDPMADGPVIQRASERALVHHVSLPQVLARVREFRSQDRNTPVVLMGYLNPIETMGYARFAESAKAAGVDGVLTVDMPPEEADELVAALRGAQLDPIFLVAPTSSEDRIRRIAEVASGFIYYVSLKGVTGAAHLEVGAVAEKLAQLRRFTSLPLGVGFGIRDAESAARIARLADAVIVGSALVSRVEALLDSSSRIPAELARAIAEMRRAMDEATDNG
jgi:tryptophan synthase alpha chain